VTDASDTRGGARGIVDAVVLGGGPNGLAGAIELARAGLSVHLIEGAPTVGGGARSAEITLPGYVHDICSAIHPFGRTSPFFRTADLESHGLRWVEPPVALGHPFDDGSAVLVRRDLDATAAQLGEDADAYRALLMPTVDGWEELLPDVLAPLHVPWPPHRAVRLARFGLLAVRSATSIAGRFHGARARGLLAGAAAHSLLRLTEPVSGAAALLMLASAHADGWPFPEGGAGRIAEAMAARLRELGGTIDTDRPIGRLEDLPPHRVAVLDVTPRQLLALDGRDRFGRTYRRELERFRYGPGVFKLDLAIDGAIPWAAEGLQQAGCVHLGGTLEEIARAEALVDRGELPVRPFVLLAQQSLFDRTRAPAGGNAVWAYCHVPNGSRADMTEPILAQVERFAPGFRDRILAVSARTPTELEAYDPNDVGGDIAGGRLDLDQLFMRPAWRIDPYSTPDPGIFLCSASTPPGGGVHGMCGAHAASSVLDRWAALVRS
jgi:phytoene dehydrogenase-like protein